MLTSLVFVAILAQSTFAQTSLFIPGMDPQPVAGQVAGVGTDGRTTWLISPGVPSGTLSDNGFSGVATLIVGPSDAELILSEPVAGGALFGDEKCVLKGDGSADCTAIVSDPNAGLSTIFETESVIFIPIQGATAAPSTPTSSPTSAPGTSPSAGSSSGTSGTAKPGSSSNSSGSPTSTSTTTSNQSSGAVGLSAKGFIWAAAGLAVYNLVL
ncbi:hypothetical protein C8Q75DRAFT_801407 [Abortiporus biennis]|nr:hypothetical protein C8Q75DRAFT_801407 [Abortiporus biennis]